MKTIKNLERLQQLHLLIETECTGSPKGLSRKMAISERLVYSLIDQLKSLNAKILYNRNRQTYYYSEAFQLYISISITVGSRNETTELYDGSYFVNKDAMQLPN